jgi:hypothetical protein
MNKSFDKYHHIAFMPIDIPYQKLDLEELQVFSDRNYIWPPDVHTNLYGTKKQKHGEYVERHPHKIWRIVCLLGQGFINSEDWIDAKVVRKSWMRRLERTSTVRINPNLPKQLYGIIDLINQLPIQCNHAELVQQRRDIPLHNDAAIDMDKDKLSPYEPAGYRLLLNDIRKPSLYFCQGHTSSVDNIKYYMDLPMDTNAFVINELDMPHGAHKIDELKWIVTTTGKLDSEKHLKLLEKSYNKYSDKIISYKEKVLVGL